MADNKPWERIPNYGDIGAESQQANADIEKAYHDQVDQKFGTPTRYDKAKGKWVLTTPSGVEYYDYGQGGTDFTRKLLRTDAPGQPQDVPYPMQDMLVKTRDALASGNPFKNNAPYNLANMSVADRLNAAGAISRWTNVKEPDGSDIGRMNGLRDARNIYKGIANDMSHLTDQDISLANRASIAGIDMSGTSLQKAGVSKYYEDLMQRLSDAQKMGISVGGEKGETKVSTPGQAFVPNFLTAVGLSAATTAADYVANSKNLTRLRQGTAQYLDQVNNDIYSTVHQKPNVNWAPEHVSLANDAAAQNETRYNFGDNPLDVDKAVPIAEPDKTSITDVDKAKIEAEAPKPSPGPKGSATPPSATAAPSPEETTKPPLQKQAEEKLKQTSEDVASNVIGTGVAATEGVSKAIGKAAEPAMNFPYGYIPGLPQLRAQLQTPNVQQAVTDWLQGRPQSEDVGKKTQDIAQRVVEPVTKTLQGPIQPVLDLFKPRAAPIAAGEPEPSPWSRYGTNPEQLPTSGYPTAETGRPGGGAENAEIGSFADTPRLALQEHVDQLPPGRRFVWHHDGQEYVKT